MSNTYTKQVRVDGSRVLVLDIYGVADATGNETLYPILDMADYNPVVGEKISKILKIKEIYYALSAGVQIRLFWEGSGSPELFAVLTAAHNHEIDWKKVGGVTNAQVPGATGRILMTTIGFDAANDLFHMQLCINKRLKTSEQNDVGHQPVNPQTGAGHSDGTPVGTPQGNPPTGALERT